MTRATTLIAIALLIPGVALAQESDESNTDESWRALVWVKDGNGELIEKVRATPQFALDAIQAEESWGLDAARKVLNQVGGPRSAAELDAFADALGRLILESPSYGVTLDALSILSSTASGSRFDTGIPYVRGADVLIGVYESMDDYESISKHKVLRRIRHAGARGEDYVRNLFASLERPEKACFVAPTVSVVQNGKVVNRVGHPPKEEHCPYETQWCEVGQILGEYDLVYPICDGRRSKINGVWGPTDRSLWAYPPESRQN